MKSTSTPMTAESGFLLGPEVLLRAEHAPSDFKDVAAAAFRMENSLASFLAEEEVPKSIRDPEYDFMATLEDEDHEHLEPIFDVLSQTNSDEERDAYISQYRRESRDREILANSGASGVFMQIAAGVLDPLMIPLLLVPLGGLGKAGMSTAKAVTSIGALGAAEAGLAEAALHSTQQTRTWQETAFSVGGGAILGGALGGLAGVSSKQYAKAVATVNEDLRSMNRDGGLEDLPVMSLEDQVVHPSLSAAGRQYSPLEGEDAGVLGPRFTPLTRMLNSPFPHVRTSANDLIRHNFYLNKNRTTVELADGTQAERYMGTQEPLEAVIDMEVRSLTTKYLNDTKKLWKDAGGSIIGTALGRSMSYPKFMGEVGKSLRRGDSHDIPEVAAAAQAIRANIINPITDRYKALGLLPEDLEVKFAESFYPRVYDVKKIRKLRSAWDAKLVQHFTEVTRKEGREKAVSRLRAIADEEGRARARVAAEKEADDVIRRQVEQEAKQNGTGAGVSARQLKKMQKQAVRSRRDVVVAQIVTEKQKAFADEVFEQLKADELPEMLAELEADLAARVKDRADDVTDNILGSIDGRPEINNRPNLPDILKERVLAIDDMDLEDYLVDNVDFVMHSYIRRAVGDLNLRERYNGDVTMEAEFNQIRKEARDAITAAKTDKEKAKLNQILENNLRDLEAVRSLMLGAYKGAGDESKRWVNTARFVRAMSFMALLGGMTVSAIPDIARPIMQHGFRAWVRALGPTFGAAIRASSVKTSNKGWRELGVAAESILGSRAFAMGLLDETNSFVYRQSQIFAQATGMNAWNSTMKMIAARTAQNRIIRDIEGYARATPRAKERLAKAGFSDNDIAGLQAQLARHKESLFGADEAATAKWEDRKLAQRFERAIFRDVENTIITPGIGDKPLFMNAQWGATLMQFKTFFMAAHNQMLLNGGQQLARGDIKFLTGASLAWGLGMLVEIAKLGEQGRLDELDDYNWADKIKAGLDRSGTMSIPMDIFNILDRFGGGRVGDFVGLNVEGSRMYQRNFAGTLAGPAVGYASDFVNAAQSLLARGELTEYDLYSFRKLMPYQNHIAARHIFDAVQEKVVEETGVKRNRRKRESKSDKVQF